MRAPPDGNSWAVEKHLTKPAISRLGQWLNALDRKPVSPGAEAGEGILQPLQIVAALVQAETGLIMPPETGWPSGCCGSGLSGTSPFQGKMVDKVVVLLVFTKQQESLGGAQNIAIHPIQPFRAGQWLRAHQWLREPDQLTNGLTEQLGRQKDLEQYPITSHQITIPTCQHDRLTDQDLQIVGPVLTTAYA